MKDKLPLGGKLLYSFGTAGWSMIDRLMITWVIFYYTTRIDGRAALISATGFGMIMTFGRIVDALADPLVARWTDNSSGSLGRRRPFLLYGGIVYVAVFIALFYPPANTGLTSIYLAVVLGLYFIMFTVYVVPYLALLPELAHTNQERVDLATFKALFSLIGVAIALIGGGIVIGVVGYQGMAWIFGFLGLVMIYMPVLINERKYAVAQPATLGLVDAVRTTFQNRPFRIYLAGNCAFWFGFNIITFGLPFYVTVLLGETEAATTVYFAAIFGVAALCFPLVNILSKRYGLKAMMVTFMLLFILLLPLFFFLGQPVLGLSPKAFAIGLLALGGIPLAGLFVLPDAILANISDMEESLSGQRREGMYFGSQGLFLKIIMGLSTWVFGILLDTFGQVPGASLGVRLSGPVAAGLILIGVLVFLRYPEQEVQQAVENNSLTA